MFEHVLFATARFETVICESGLFDSVMFETGWWARVDVIMNTVRRWSSLAGLPHGILHVTKKLGWEPWRRTSLRSPHSGESDSDGEGSYGNVHGSALNFK